MLPHTASQGRLRLALPPLFVWPVVPTAHALHHLHAAFPAVAHHTAASIAHHPAIHHSTARHAAVVVSERQGSEKGGGREDAGEEHRFCLPNHEQAPSSQEY
jgi:hypothetical protein